MPRPDRPRVLLLWPGGLFGGGGNFGVPQLLSIAGAIRRRTEALVDVVDLDAERAFGPFDLARVLAPGYDLIGISCYSSYDYLKVMEIAARARRLLPRAWLVTGGYHASARPGDFTRPGSPIDFVIVGDGEGPMAALCEALATGRRPLQRELGPASSPDPGEGDPYDWSLLERYRPVARKVASQAEIYLSRGCPYDCAFCMERAKRDVSWRALEPARAVEELHRLDRFLDLRGWTLFIADALFGMKRPWRREFLEGLARRPIRADKIWALIRLDLLEREDLALMARANVAPGFGLESGDPAQLRRIRKSGKLDGYLEHMMDVAAWARELGVPWGANVIVGHPGETEASIRASADYLSRLFLGDPRGTLGFLSVDPFRLYPGSPIDEDLAGWQERTGVRVHRYPWWHDGDQDFLSEWVDPSASLRFEDALRLRRALFTPILRAVRERFAYQGPARGYFVRAIDEQIAHASERRFLRSLGLAHLWRDLAAAEAGAWAPGEARRALLADTTLAEIAAGARAEELAGSGVRGVRGVRDVRDVTEASPRLLAALRDTPRERFVRLEDVAASADDRALPLDDDGASTISAMHAYAAAFDALELGEGDELVDLGGGTGYGAAVAAAVVGPRGRVITVEIDPALAAAARENLAGQACVEVIAGDAHDVARWRGARKVAVGFAVDEVPAAWLDALAEGGALVAPVADRHRDRQALVRFVKGASGVTSAPIAEVRYVVDRSPLRSPPPPAPEPGARATPGAAP